MKNKTIGVVATSSVIPKIELDLSIQKILREGFEVTVHPAVSGEHWLYSAPDEERASAFVEYALNPHIDILWCARGGYGATHLLPLLDKKLSRKNKKSFQ